MLLDVCARFVYFVYGNDVGKFCRFDAIECLDGLRLDAVFSRDDEDGDVGRIRSALAYVAKCLMSGRVDECDASLAVCVRQLQLRMRRSTG